VCVFVGYFLMLNRGLIPLLIWSIRDRVTC